MTGSVQKSPSLNALADVTYEWDMLNWCAEHLIVLEFMRERISKNDYLIRVSSLLVEGFFIHARNLRDLLYDPPGDRGPGEDDVVATKFVPAWTTIRECQRYSKGRHFDSDTKNPECLSYKANKWVGHLTFTRVRGEQPDVTEPYARDIHGALRIRLDRVCAAGLQASPTDGEPWSKLRSRLVPLRDTPLLVAELSSSPLLAPVYNE